VANGTSFALFAHAKALDGLKRLLFMPTVLLSLGSNQQPQRYLRLAVHALQQRFAPIRVSPAYRTQAVGFVGPDFLNNAVKLETNLSLAELENWLHAVEDGHGRKRSPGRYANRTLDMDVVYYGNAVIFNANNTLRIPRPEIKHAFVLKPLADIAPEFIDPVQRLSLLTLWQRHPDYGKAMEIVELDSSAQQPATV